MLKKSASMEKVEVQAKVEAQMSASDPHCNLDLSLPARCVHRWVLA